MGGLLPHYNYNFTRLVNRHSRDGSSATRIRMDDELEKTTYHEAGHCVMAVLCGAEVGRATIAPEEDGFHGIVEIYWPSGSSMADQLSVAMAGDFFWRTVPSRFCTGVGPRLETSLENLPPENSQRSRVPPTARAVCC